MPTTTDSTTGFAKLVETRTRLNEISLELREALESRGILSFDNRYRELQAKWDDARLAFEAATEEFSATIRRIHDELETDRAENGGGRYPSKR
jgi:hypothetical protein